MENAVIILSGALFASVCFGLKFYLWFRKKKACAADNERMRSAVYEAGNYYSRKKLYDVVHPTNCSYAVRVYAHGLGWICVKSFVSDDPGYAELCAKEFLDNLEEDIEP